MRIAETKLWYAIKPYVPKRFWDDILNVIYWIRSFQYKGDQYECPICHCQLGRFAKNSCPRCNSGNRHRALWLYLNRKTDLFTRPNLKLLHFAPEHCLHKKIRTHQNIDYLSGDLNSTRAMEKIDMMDIQYPDNYFDVTIGLDVLMHVDDDSLAMRELVRVQKPEGWSIHLVSIDSSLEKTVYAEALGDKSRSEVFGHFDYKRNYGQDYNEILEANGFDVDIVGTDEYTSPEERNRFQIPDYFKIYLCKKRKATSAKS